MNEQGKRSRVSLSEPALGFVRSKCKTEGKSFTTVINEIIEEAHLAARCDGTQEKLDDRQHNK